MPNLGIPQMQMPPISMPQMNQFKYQSSGPLVPGSAPHAAAFHAKGPDNEIKLFVGGLAF